MSNPLDELSDFLPEGEEVIDAETAAKLDSALAELGDDVPLEEVRRVMGT